MDSNNDLEKSDYIRIGIAEHRITSLENQLKRNNEILEDIKETNTKMKSLVGAISIVISGLWLVVTTFKEGIMHWLTGK